MRTADFNSNIVDQYFQMLRGLSQDVKLGLITRLSESIRSSGKEKEVSLDELYGSFISEESADGVIDSLKY